MTLHIVDIRNIQTWRELTTLLGSEIGNALPFLFTLELMRERKEDCVEVGESRAGLGLQDS